MELRRPAPALFLCDSRVRVVEEAHFLGLLFDKWPSWASHTRQLQQSCQKPLNLLYHLSHTSWGPDREILPRLYTSPVLSKLDYNVSTQYKVKYCAVNRFLLLDSNR